MSTVEVFPPPGQLFDIAAERQRRYTERTAESRQQQVEACKQVHLAALGVSAEAMATDPERALTHLLELQRLAKAQMEALSETAHEHWRAAARARFGTERQFTIAYIDPPWQYKSRRNGSATDNHYATMSDDELMHLPVRGLLKENAAIAMWATAPKLDVAHRLLAAWGFQFRTVFLTWVKVSASNQVPVYSSDGAYSKPNCEFLLLAVRGSLQVAHQSGYTVDSVLETRRAEHSHKPDCVRSLLVRTLGDRTRIELFARETVPGWFVWGNEVEKFNRLNTAPQPVARRDDDDGDDADGGFDNSSRRLLIRAGRRRSNNLSAVPTRKEGVSYTMPLGRADRGVDSVTVSYNAPADGTKMTKSDFVLRGHSNKRARLFNHVPDLRAYFAADGVQLRERRHDTYPTLTLREADECEKLIVRGQEHNDEMLYAMLHNPNRRFVRYSDPEMADRFDDAIRPQVEQRVDNAPVFAVPLKRKRKAAVVEVADDVDSI